MNQQTSGEDVEKKKHFCTVGGNADWCNHCAKLFGDTSKNKTWSCLLVSLLVIYPNKPQTLIQKNIHTPMVIAVLFTITKIWKEPKCPSIEEWIKQL